MWLARSRGAARIIKEYYGHQVSFGKLVQITFNRTLRVPDDGREYSMPPGYHNNFPLLSLRQCPPGKVPAAWRAAQCPSGLMPMYQREAMWMPFVFSQSCAIKISIGGINAVSGEPRNPNALSRNPQDYVVCPEQPWLDGIHAGPDTTRQFIAMPLGSDYTVEAQITGVEKQGGLQIDVFPPLITDLKAFVVPDTMKPWVRDELDCSKTPAELGLKETDTLVLRSSALPKEDRTARIGDFVSPRDSEITLYVIERTKILFILTLDGRYRKLTDVEFGTSVFALKERIQELEDIPTDQQHLCFADKLLDDDTPIEYYGIGDQSALLLVPRLRGGDPEYEKAIEFCDVGNMRRKIYEDKHGPDHWFIPGRMSFNLYVLNSQLWNAITCLKMPDPVISILDYTREGLPWFDSYDEVQRPVS